jgi:PAS domain S-box-containing protein
VETSGQEWAVEPRVRERSAVWRYGLAIVAVAGAVVATWALQLLGLEHPPAPFLAAILLCGWYAGTGPAIVAVLLSTFAFDFFFLPPLYSLDLIRQPNPYLLVFLLFAVLAGWFSAARQRNVRLLEQARAHLEERVAARTAELEQVNRSLEAEIGERRRTEAELRERTAQLDELFDQAPEAIALLGLQAEVLRINREFTRLFGYTADEAVGRTARTLVVPEELEEEGRRFSRRITELGERVEAETIRRTRDGKRVQVSLVATPIIVAGRQVAEYVMYRDVTERTRLENELRRSEAYLVAGQRLSHTGSWARRVASGDIYWSEEAFRIFGLEPTGSIGTELLAAMWHPDDRERAEATMEAAIRDKQAYDMDVRIVRPDGSIRYVHTRGQPVLDESGEVVELMGAVMDVTDRKRAERALRRARERTMEARFAAVLDERTRLAREIHDTLLQGFTGVALQLLAATGRVTGPPEIIPTLRDLVTLAQKTLEDARRAVWDMRSPSLGGGDFSAALRAITEEGLRGTPLELEFGTEGIPRPLDPDAEAVMLRVLQEAIANIVKHAAARRVRVGLSYEARGARLSVTDDGRGFAVHPDVHTYGGHWGLLGMRERASQIRAKLSVRSTPGHGTEVVLLAPYAPRPQSPNPVRT